MSKVEMRFKQEDVDNTRNDSGAAAVSWLRQLSFSFEEIENVGEYSACRCAIRIAQECMQAC